MTAPTPFSEAEASAAADAITAREAAAAARVEATMAQINTAKALLDEAVKILIKVAVDAAMSAAGGLSNK